MELSPGGSGKEEIILSRKELYLLVKDQLGTGMSNVIKKLEKDLTDQSGSTVEIREEMKPVLARLFYKMRSMWQAAGRSKARFFVKNKAWLDVTISLPVATPKVEKSKRKGRPTKEFTSSSERTKRRKTEEVRTTLTSSELAYALQMALRSEGQLIAAKVVKDVTSVNPSRASEYRAVLKSKVETSLSEDAALSILVDYKFSKRQYQGLRSISKEYNCKLYPSYSKVVEAKKRCYPPKTAITITDDSAEVKLQALFNHTLDRILLLKNDVIGSSNVSHMELICKWGCFGEIIRHGRNSSEDTESDAHVFFASVVPLQLVCVNHAPDAKVIVWQNPRASSPRFCRPLRLRLLHEDTAATVNEVENIKEEIKSLVPFTTVVGGKEISIISEVEFTMTDGQACSAVSATSAQRCSLCGMTSEYFNEIDAIIKRDVDAPNLGGGSSISQTWIRVFECCLNLSYNLGIKKWQASGEEEKRIIEDRKRIVQEELSTKLGLNIDRPRPGHGNFNDCNTVQRFFKSPAVSALITGVDEVLIERFHVILQAVSSNHEINCEKFKEYALETARYFVKLYPWYRMPTPVHELLIHGSEIIASAFLPIEQLSRGACHEHIKRLREALSPRCSREKRIRDVINQWLVTSDPCISSSRKLPCKQLESVSPKTVELLLSPTKTASTATEACRTVDTDSDVGSDSDVDSGSDVDSE